MNEDLFDIIDKVLAHQDVLEPPGPVAQILQIATAADKSLCLQDMIRVLEAAGLQNEETAVRVQLRKLARTGLVTLAGREPRRNMAGYMNRVPVYRWIAKGEKSSDA